MPQRSKGDRDQVTVRPPKQLGVKKVAEKAGYNNTSQFVSDFLALALGHPELVEGPNVKKGQESLPGMPNEQDPRGALTSLLSELLARQERADERQVAPAA